MSASCSTTSLVHRFFCAMVRRRPEAPTRRSGRGATATSACCSDASFPQRVGSWIFLRVEARLPLQSVAPLSTTRSARHSVAWVATESMGQRRNCQQLGVDDRRAVESVIYDLSRKSACESLQVLICSILSLPSARQNQKTQHLMFGLGLACLSGRVHWNCAYSLRLLASSSQARFVDSQVGAEAAATTNAKGRCRRPSPFSSCCDEPPRVSRLSAEVQPPHAPSRPRALRISVRRLGRIRVSAAGILARRRRTTKELRRADCGAFSSARARCG